MAALRSTIGDADGDIAVEIGAGKKHFRGGAVSKMGDRGRDDIAPPGILERHANPHGDAQIASLADFAQAPELTNLQIHNIHGQIASASQEHLEAIDIFV
jgi:hypothetical protein